MRALLLQRFGEAPALADVEPPALPAGAVRVAVTATGLCRSDWHAVMGHDSDVVLPHVPGHEFAGTVAEVGDGLDAAWLGRRVTAPFVQACGVCELCRAGEHQVCPDQVQPGFTRWGSFAESVVVERAAVNLVPLPDDVDDVSAASLGCRFATAFRAVVDVARVRPGESVVVVGCGGVGLSAVMIAAAAGARVIAVDTSRAALARAAEAGAVDTVLPPGRPDDGLDARTLHPGVDGGVVGLVRVLTGGGAHVGVDAVGSASALATSLACLRPRGRHVQVGLLPPGLGLPAVPMHLVIGGELQLLGSHGMAAHSYPRMLDLIARGALTPSRLVAGVVPLAEAGTRLLGPATDGVLVAVP